LPHHPLASSAGVCGRTWASCGQRVEISYGPSGHTGRVGLFFSVGCWSWVVVVAQGLCGALPISPPQACFALQICNGIPRRHGTAWKPYSPIRVAGSGDSQHAPTVMHHSHCPALSLPPSRIYPPVPTTTLAHFLTKAESVCGVLPCCPAAVLAVALQLWQGVRGGSEHLVMAEICHVGQPLMLLGSDAPEEVCSAIDTLHANPSLLTVRARPPSVSAAGCWLCCSDRGRGPTS
jgi:hypothetical protein